MARFVLLLRKRIELEEIIIPLHQRDGEKTYSLDETGTYWIDAEVPGFSVDSTFLEVVDEQVPPTVSLSVNPQTVITGKEFTVTAYRSRGGGGDKEIKVPVVAIRS